MKTKKITLSELRELIKNIINEDRNDFYTEDHVTYKPNFDDIISRFKHNVRIDMKMIVDNTEFTPTNPREDEEFLEELYTEMLAPLRPFLGEYQFLQSVDKMVDAKLRKMKITK